LAAEIGFKLLFFQVGYDGTEWLIDYSLAQGDHLTLWVILGIIFYSPDDPTDSLKALKKSRWPVR